MNHIEKNWLGFTLNPGQNNAERFLSEAKLGHSLLNSILPPMASMESVSHQNRIGHLSITSPSNESEFLRAINNYQAALRFASQHSALTVAEDLHLDRLLARGVPESTVDKMKQMLASDACTFALSVSKDVAN